mmetsp:Transcript_79131/g.219949  ORF Transcript_79131/g.219949 Transcript_79131/m.219949 type:complete len:734 (-) Transcript_79131:128-2329(-)
MASTERPSSDMRGYSAAHWPSFLQQALVPAVNGDRSQRSTILGPQTHRLPCGLMWLITLLTALAMALINFVSILAIEWSIRLKFGFMQFMIERQGVVSGVIALTFVSMCYAYLGVYIIERFAPNCGGSGLPENKCYLNGSKVPGFFTRMTLQVRVVTVILSNAAGYPVGREGPTVTIGSNVASLISEALARPYVEEWIDVTRPGGVPALIVDEERFADATRIACAVGGACGMAMIFNAPFGGFLYMFEEVTSVSWPLELTFRIFVATMCCSMVSYGLLNLCGKDIFEFVIFAWAPEVEAWKWRDVPLIVAMSALLGVLTSLHTRGCLFVGSIRQWSTGKLQRWHPSAKTIETVVYSAICALVSAGTALLAYCEEQGGSELQYVAFNCGEGQYNPIASLLVNTSHSSVKLLFSSNNTGEIQHDAAIVAFVAYYLLNVCLTGLPVPGGAFTATMLLGGLFGRFFGEAGQRFGFITTVSGIYAVVGSAAMLSGFKQMTLAVVLIVVECVNNLSLAPLVMLGVSVSLMVNWAINKRGHDEEQIRRRQLPFLEGEAPCMLDSLVAHDLCDPLLEEVALPQDAPIGKVRRALDETTSLDFPVIDPDSGSCVGIVTRPHLEAALETATGHPSQSGVQSLTCSSCLHDSERLLQERVALELGEQAPEGAGRQLRLGARDTLPLDRIMDPTPLTILEDMPAPRLYALFAKAGERAACVVSRKGDFRGIISRGGLIAATRRLS